MKGNRGELGELCGSASNGNRCYARHAMKNHVQNGVDGVLAIGVMV
jgi:hypothetical protein